MANELVLYTNPMSRGRIARWMMEEVDAPYRTEVVEYGPAMKSEEYLAVNPMGKVPALVHGDSVITECAAICAYMADAFPEAGLAPALADRADYYRWMFFAAGPVESALTSKMLGFAPTDEQMRSVGYGNYQTMLDGLEGAVSGGGYVAGPNFTAADVYVGSHVGWGLQFKTIEVRPAFEEYWAMVSDRDAYRRGNELDDALMASSSS